MRFHKYWIICQVRSLSSYRFRVACNFFSETKIKSLRGNVDHQVSLIPDRKHIFPFPVVIWSNYYCLFCFAGSKNWIKFCLRIRQEICRTSFGRTEEKTQWPRDEPILTCQQQPNQESINWLETIQKHLQTCIARQRWKKSNRCALDW